VKEKLWTGLLILTVGASLWFGGKFLFDLYNYTRFSNEVQVQVDKWEVADFTGKEYQISASFHFDVDKTRFHKEFTFKKPTFSNKEAAKHYLDELNKNSWRAWYVPGQPETAELQRFFPVKAMIRFILFIGIVVYFFWLKGYVFSLLEER